jgi:hypothetical protein
MKSMALREVIGSFVISFMLTVDEIVAACV